MAEAILLSGKRGEGKSISAVRMMSDYIRRGCCVATNMDIFLEHLDKPYSELVCYRLPDHPTLRAFEALPLGNPNPVDEKRNGLLVLDEVATFLNSRDWQAKERAAVISWLLHSRKFGWDLLLIAQHPRLVDAQIRDALCELSATARRADKFVVPVVGGLFKLATGKPLKLPRAHIVTFRYGFAPNAPRVDLWWFSGAAYQKGYDSLQKISMAGQEGVSCYLPAWHLKGRYMSKVGLVRVAAVAAFVLGLMVGAAGGWFGRDLQPQSSSVAVAAAPSKVNGKVFVQGVLEDGSRLIASLTDGQVLPVTASRADSSGVLYQVAGSWYRRK
jgi:hypothetical protein